MGRGAAGYVTFVMYDVGTETMHDAWPDKLSIELCGRAGFLDNPLLGVAEVSSCSLPMFGNGQNVASK